METTLNYKFISNEYLREKIYPALTLKKDFLVYQRESSKGNYDAHKLIE